MRNIKIAVMFIISTILILIFSNSALAMKKQDAYRASEILRPRMVVRKYCAPCGDSRWTHITIKRVRVRRKGYDYRLFINGREVKLSNFYIKIHGNWVNIAMLIGMDVEKGVPEFLPARNRIP